MQRLIEILLGLGPGFLSKEGEFSIQFNPKWPLQWAVGAVTWNLVLGALGLMLVVYVYRREGRAQFSRILLGTLRGLLVLFTLALLNRPVVTLSQSRQDPSILAFAIDDSVSMGVKDGPVGRDGQGASRLEAVLNLLNGENQKLIKELSKKHDLRFFRFSRDAQPITFSSEKPAAAPAAGPTTAPAAPENAFANVKPVGQNTQILSSLRTVMESLQGQQVAGVVVLTDGRDTPLESLSELLPSVQKFGYRVYPITVGAEKSPQNISVESINVQEAAFVKDIVSVKSLVRAIGYPPGHEVMVQLRTKTGQQLLRADGQPAQQIIQIANDAAQEVELNFKPTAVGNLDLVVEALKQPGEVDDEDNTFPAQISVLDAKVAVLYVEGYPRWEYRYIKNEMIRDETVDISCLLLSADKTFSQEGDKPIKRFPEDMTELLAYDVVIFGDVDQREFTDKQLALVQEFVSKKGGGFALIAGPRFAPYTFKGKAIEPILPVSLNQPYQPQTETITFGWRPSITREGGNTTIFRFFENKEVNAKFLRDEIQPIFWYCKGPTLKPGVGEVLAEHPMDSGADGRKAPLIVMGRYGAGRTLYAGIDDAWRWRFYKGEQVFDNYWVQQIRYLARSKKLGQRKFALTTLRPSYELGEQVQVSLRVLDPELLPQLPEQISVTLEDSKGQVVRKETMQRQEGQNDYYVASWQADAVGQYNFKLPPLGGSTQSAEQPILVKVPRLELQNPSVDRTLISKLAEKVEGKEGVSVEPDISKLNLATQPDYDIIRAELVKIPTASQVIAIDTNEPLWNAPLAMALFVLLITLEWVLRKMYGML